MAADPDDLAKASRVSESVAMGEREPVARLAARVLIIDERSRLLLFGHREPTTGDEFWATPGGGIESGESPLEAARREVLEETGHLPPEQLGPVI